ncbi:hypothetical protein [Nocardia sp. NBC_00403]|uniref:hypothetical protein n=1 Tax=Nocardia sp. NBC_00403 TaxID=2975990 RepID=UPI002E22102F
MSETDSTRRDIAPSVQALLAIFHEDTVMKLELAPADSKPTLYRSDGSSCAVDEYGWPANSGDPAEDELVDLEPTAPALDQPPTQRPSGGPPESATR